MPRHKQQRVSIPIGVSFSPADIDWLKTTYGTKLSTTDLVRCTIQDAKFWRTAQEPATVNAQMQVHAAHADAQKPADWNINDWEKYAKTCDVSGLFPEDQRADSIQGA